MKKALVIVACIFLAAPLCASVRDSLLGVKGFVPDSLILENGEMPRHNALIFNDTIVLKNGKRIIHHSQCFGGTGADLRYFYFNHNHQTNTFDSVLWKDIAFFASLRDYKGNVSEVNHPDCEKESLGNVSWGGESREGYSVKIYGFDTDKLTGKKKDSQFQIGPMTLMQPYVKSGKYRYTVYLNEKPVEEKVLHIIPCRETKIEIGGK